LRKRQTIQATDRPELRSKAAVSVHVFVEDKCGGFKRLAFTISWLSKVIHTSKPAACHCDQMNMIAHASG